MSPFRWNEYNIDSILFIRNKYIFKKKYNIKNNIFIFHVYHLTRYGIWIRQTSYTIYRHTLGKLISMFYIFKSDMWDFYISIIKYICIIYRDVWFGFKGSQIGPKLDKSVTFSDQISIYFGSLSQNVLNSDLRKSRICPIWDQSDPLWS